MRADGAHALFWVVGMIVGSAIVAMTAKSYADGRGRSMRPLIAVMAALFGLAIGWALNAWFDYIQFTKNGGGGSM
jgi:hypothetical protein